MKNALFAAFAAMLCAVGVLVYVQMENDEPRQRRGVYLESVRPAAPAPVAVQTAPRTPVAAPRDPVATPVVAAPLPAARVTGPQTRLVIGRISDNVRKHWPRLEAMANYLAPQLADVGVTGIDVRMVDTVEEMHELLRAGEVDFVSETAFAAIEMTQDGAAEMLLREWKSGVADYHTVIFARRDSGIGGLDDLVGRSFVFEDRGSTSGYLVPRAHMARTGYDLVELDGVLAQPPRGAIGFSFADDEGTVVSRVLRGFADVGALSNLDWADEDEVTETERRDLVIVHETDPIIRSIMLVRSSLDPRIKERLASVLEGMHETQAGMETLREYWKVARFDRIEGPALESLLTARVLHETFRSF